MRYRNNPLVVGGLLAALFVFLALFGPSLAPLDPMEIYNDPIFVGDEVFIPSVMPLRPFQLSQFPLGTDNAGRDLLSRLLHAIRPTLLLCLIIVSLRLAVGITLGLVGGWYRGITERLIEFGIGASLSIPILIFSLATLSFMGERELPQFMFALTVTGWANIAVFVKNHTQSVIQAPFIEGARAVGVRPVGILWRYILPQLWPVLPAIIAFELSAVLLLVAELGFLGMFIGNAFVQMAADPNSSGVVAVGLTASMPELGQMLSDFWSKMIRTPWEMVVIGLVVFFQVFAFNMLGEGLRRQMDITRSRGVGRKRRGGRKTAVSLPSITQFEPHLLGQKPLLHVKNLVVHFDTPQGTVHAVSGVSFTLNPGESLAIVGESGSGKTVTGHAIIKLIDTPPGRFEKGEILFQGHDLLQLPEQQMQKIRGREIAYIFQDAMTALNPARTIGQQLQEGIRLHYGLSQQEARRRAVELLQLVGIPDAERRLEDYPWQFSGGQRQRILFAMALSCDPKLLIADEPTTGLDVTVQAQIVSLVKELKTRLDMAVIWISHDLGVVAGLVDRVVVLYGGMVMEMAPVRPLYKNTTHPYTLGLLQSLPKVHTQDRQRLIPIDGQPPDPHDFPKGCPFAPRCRFVVDKCKEEIPPLIPVAPQHYTACWQWEIVQAAPKA
ncbi:MAG: ATP-binding cassette domain-containing protein [Chloroflexi bacterium]|nr:MAG: ATP-binding cassette domain-containing protein [Chloroflexota bacterium]